MKNLESALQISCVTWFRMQYPQYAGLIFSIPNGGKRSVITATIMKREGALAGVADLFLAVADHKYPLNENTLCNGLFLEIKYGKNKQSESQKKFQKNVESQGYRYELIYDFDSFENVIEDYLL